MYLFEFHHLPFLSFTWPLYYLLPPCNYYYSHDNKHLPQLPFQYFSCLGTKKCYIKLWIYLKTTFFNWLCNILKVGQTCKLLFWRNKKNVDKIAAHHNSLYTHAKPLKCICTAGNYFKNITTCMLNFNMHLHFLQQLQGIRWHLVLDLLWSVPLIRDKWTRPELTLAFSLHPFASSI